MSNIIVCQRGFVNRVNFTSSSDDSKNRLNVTVGGTLGYGDKKKYVTYELTIWGKQAIALQSMVVASDKKSDTKGSQVSFVGELEEVVTNVDKNDSSKIYTSLRVKPFLGQFNLIGDKPIETTKTKSKSTLNETDEPTGKVDEEF